MNVINEINTYIKKEQIKDIDIQNPTVEPEKAKEDRNEKLKNLLKIQGLCKRTHLLRAEEGVVMDWKRGRFEFRRSENFAKYWI